MMMMMMMVTTVMMTLKLEECAQNHRDHYIQRKNSDQYAKLFPAPLFGELTEE
jgi:hypothetical protein